MGKRGRKLRSKNRGEIKRKNKKMNIKM